jgi:hypothetical protein
MSLSCQSLYSTASVCSTGVTALFFVASGLKTAATASWTARSDCASRHGDVTSQSPNNRVSVFSVEGEFVRHVGVGVLKYPHGVACSASDELVVADAGSGRIVVFSASGELLTTVGCGAFTGVAIHGGTIFAQDHKNEKCFLFS